MARASIARQVLHTSARERGGAGHGVPGLVWLKETSPARRSFHQSTRALCAARGASAWPPQPPDEYPLNNAVREVIFFPLAPRGARTEHIQKTVRAPRRPRLAKAIRTQGRPLAAGRSARRRRQWGPCWSCWSQPRSHGLPWRSTARKAARGGAAEPKF